MQAEESEVLRSEAAAFQNEKANTEENDVVRVAAPAASEEAAAKEGCPLHVRCLPQIFLPLLVGDLSLIHISEPTRPY